SSTGDCQTWPKPEATFAGVRNVSFWLKPVRAASPWNCVVSGAPGCCPSTTDGARRSSNVSRLTRARQGLAGRGERRVMTRTSRGEGPRAITAEEMGLTSLSGDRPVETHSTTAPRDERAPVLKGTRDDRESGDKLCSSVVRPRQVVKYRFREKA